jgi:hypothetical protein
MHKKYWKEMKEVKLKPWKISRILRALFYEWQDYPNKKIIMARSIIVQTGGLPRSHFDLK